jgi:exopolyphosphatase/guanosine-5'-triphosphate,3'-diphosphate pyrophosphatase
MIAKSSGRNFLIIDCGSLTFNALVGEYSEGTIKRHLVLRKVVGLQQGMGLDRKIDFATLSRATEAILSILKESEVLDIKATYILGTSALREAVNGVEWCNGIYALTGFEVKIISGLFEAELVSKAVSSSSISPFDPYLLIDIGGGSSEMAIMNTNTLSNVISIPIGVSRLLQDFNPSDPMSADEKRRMTERIHYEFRPFLSLASRLQVKTMVGVSGFFETLHDLIYPNESSDSWEMVPLALDDYYDWESRLVSMRSEERMLVPRLQAFRSKLIPIGFQIFNVCIQIIQPDFILCHNYGLKEGALLHYAGLE